MCQNACKTEQEASRTPQHRFKDVRLPICPSVPCLICVVIILRDIEMKLSALNFTEIMLVLARRLILNQIAQT